MNRSRLSSPSLHARSRTGNHVLKLSRDAMLFLALCSISIFFSISIILFSNHHNKIDHPELKISKLSKGSFKTRTYPELKSTKFHENIKSSNNANGKDQHLNTKQNEQSFIGITDTNPDILDLLNFKQPVKSAFEASEQASLNLLQPDKEFISSKRYKEMEQHIKEKYDFESLRNSFIQKGFVTFKPDIPEETLAKASEFTNNPQQSGHDHQDRFVDIPAVREVALNYDILAMLAVLHGHDPYPFQTLNFIKSSQARTHSDYIHFAAHPVALMSAAWVALMDINPDSGPVFYYEGSHKLPPFNMQDFGLDDRSKHPLNYAKYQDIMTATMKKLGFEYREAMLKRGEVFIWSSNLIHGGPPAKDPNLLRLSQVTHYFFRNSNYNWAPVASEVNNNGITYYNESAVDYKWGTKGTIMERRNKSKFMISSCDYMTNGKSSAIPNPCDIPHRMPQVLSRIFEHKGEKGNDVIM